MEYYKNLDLADIIYFDEEGNQKTEQWKDIPKYIGLYQVSDLGRVKSLQKTILSKTSVSRTYKELIMKQSISEKYLVVGLTKNKKAKQGVVHRLMAIAFLNHKPCGMRRVIDHIDENKINNTLPNIQIISHRLNVSKSIKNVSSKYTGVHWDKQRNKWASQIRINGKIKHLGCFSEEIEASKAYNKVLKFLGEI
jgi:hypothetical protein